MDFTWCFIAEGCAHPIEAGAICPFVPALCRAGALSLTLERHLRIGDNVSLHGHVERNTRRQIPVLKRDWDLVVTRAHVPRFQNWLRRQFVRGDSADD